MDNLFEREEIYRQIGKDKCLNVEKGTIEKRSQVIGSLLAHLRLQRGYTQKELSSAIGLAQQTYAGYETGRHEPSIEILIRIADIYGVSLDLLTGRYLSTFNPSIQDNVLDEEIGMSHDDNLKLEIHEHHARKVINRVKTRKSKKDQVKGT